MQTIVYQVKEGLYVNLTNRCPCVCAFCLRGKAPGVYGSPSLWLEREPTAREVLDALAALRRGPAQGRRPAGADRLSIGLEHVDDITAELDRALGAV